MSVEDSPEIEKVGMPSVCFAEGDLLTVRPVTAGEGGAIPANDVFVPTLRPVYSRGKLSRGCRPRPQHGGALLHGVDGMFSALSIGGPGALA